MSIDLVAISATMGLSLAYRSRFSVVATHRSWAVALLSAVMLAACAKGGELRSDDQTRMVPTEKAFALPEAGGPEVTAVLERRYSNATEQDVLLATSAATPGQNMLRIQIFGPVNTALSTKDSLRPGYLPARNINAEMRELFPGVRMQTSAFYVQNKYGPFGYAVGRASSGDTCFFGWQRLTSTGMAQTWIGNKGSIQVRLRLCDQNASEQRLLQSMYGFTINASFKDKNWNPYGVPLPPSETLGRGGAPMYPVRAARFETVTEPVAEPSAPPRRRATSKQRAATDLPPRLPPPIGPVIPLPPGSEVPASSGASVIRAPAATLPSGSSPLVPPPPCSPESQEQRCN